DPRRKPGHEPAQERVGPKAYLDRDALHDAHEIAGRIVGGDQRECRSAAGREAVDKALDRDVWITVDADSHRLARTDIFELCLLEIGDNIKIGDRYDVEQRRPR